MIPVDEYGRIIFGMRTDINKVRKKFKSYKNNPVKIAKAIDTEHIKWIMQVLDRWDKETARMRDDLIKVQNGEIQDNQ